MCLHNNNDTVQRLRANGSPLTLFKVLRIQRKNQNSATLHSHYQHCYRYKVGTNVPTTQLKHRVPTWSYVESGDGTPIFNPNLRVEGGVLHGFLHEGAAREEQTRLTGIFGSQRRVHRAGTPRTEFVVVKLVVDPTDVLVAGRTNGSPTITVGVRKATLTRENFLAAIQRPEVQKRAAKRAAAKRAKA